MDKLRNYILAVVFSLALPAYASTFCIAANGTGMVNAPSDAATGLSNGGTCDNTANTHPWLHAPGMPTATGTAASTVPAAGDRFIFRGGDTWWRGANTPNFYFSGTEPVPCSTGSCGWTWTSSGSSGNLIYIGVQQTWFTGGSWTRPQFNGGNTLSTSTTIASCGVGGNADNSFLSLNFVSFVQVDNLEFLGVCFQLAAISGTITAAGAVRAGNVVTITTTAAHGGNSTDVGQTVTIAGVTDASFNGTFTIASVPSTTTFTYALPGADTTSGSGTASAQPPFGQDSYLGASYNATNQGNNLFTKLYLHGWTHKQFACTGINPLVGTCDYPVGVPNSSQQNFGGGDKWDQILCDGTDSPDSSYGCFFGDMYELSRSTLRNASQLVIVNNMFSVHDNVFDLAGGPGDGFAHLNSFEANSEFPASGGTSHFFYNNRFSRCRAGTSFELQLNPDPTVTTYAFNNIFETSTGGVSDCQFATANNGGKVRYLNNTLARANLGQISLQANDDFENNLVVDSSWAGNTSGTTANNISGTNAQICTQRGYCSANDYRYTDGVCTGLKDALCPIGNGLDFGSVCSITPGFTLCSDTTDGNSRTPKARGVRSVRGWLLGTTTLQNRQPTRWDVGAYQQTSGRWSGGATMAATPSVPVVNPPTARVPAIIALRR